MKRLLFAVILFLTTSICWGQSIVQRSGSSVTALDQNLFIGNSFRLPVFLDTTAANLVTSLDSCGKEFYAYSTASIWVRSCIGASSRIWLRQAKYSDITGGTVTSVSGLSPLFTVANATTTPTFSLISQNQNLVYASPNGSSGVPSFRALVSGDLPSSSPYTWQKTLVAGSTLNQANIIGGGANDFTWQNMGTYTINSTNDLTLNNTTTGVSQLSLGDNVADIAVSNSGGSRISQIELLPDSIRFFPGLGNMRIDTLALASSATNKKVMVWDEVTKHWEQISPSSIVTATPTLQQVVTAGATTTDTITTTNLKLSTLPPYSLMRNIQNSFGGTDSVVIAAGVIRGDASGGAGSFITWTFLSDATDHSKLYFTSVAGVATGGIRVTYPTTQKVVSFIAAPDETLSSEGMVMGATVALDHADIFAYLPTQNGGNIVGAGGTTWTKSNKITGWSFDYNSSTGLTRLNATDVVNVTDGDYEAIQLTYSGSNPYLIKRVYSGLSSYNVGFYLTDILGNPVTGNLSSSDNVTITLKPKVSLANGYQVAGNNYEASIWTALSNIWIIAVFKK